MGEVITLIKHAELGEAAGAQKNKNIKKHFVLSLLAGLGWLSSVGAERVAPTFPEFVNLENGKDYYFYNVGVGKFLSTNDDGVYAYFGDTGLRAKVASIEGGGYSVVFTSSGKYFYRNGSTALRVDQSFSNNYCVWSIASTDNESYTIQTALGKSYYDASKFVGWKSGDNKVYPDCTADGANIEWKLIDGDAGDMYCARLRLYNALEAMEGMGCNIDKFEEIYADVESTVDEINNAATILDKGRNVTSKYQFPDWNDYPILLEPSIDGKWELQSSSGSNIMYIGSLATDESSVLTATVVVDQDATLCFDLYGSTGKDMYLKVDGDTVRSLGIKQIQYKKRYFQELKSGKHVIEWCANNSYGVTICDIGVERTPLITVNLLEPGSLGTEILYNVDHVKDVRRLKINGSMNDDDWRIIEMMKGNLFALDLSGTDVEVITESRFYGSSNCPFLHAVLLPEGLKTIESYAFRDISLDSINFPQSLEKIGYRAFESTNITKALLPDKCLNLETEIFRDCYYLEYSCLPDDLTEIPNAMYRSCYRLKTFKLPSKLKNVTYYAFYDCYSTAFDLPESLTDIGTHAFCRTNQFGEKDSLIIPKSVVSIGDNAFLYCNNYIYAEMPVAYYNVNGGSNCLPTSIKTLRLNCPTVVKHSSRIIDDNCRPNITLQVPSFLVNSYKLDEYWYEFGAIEGFETEEIDEWVLNSDLVLGARERLNGTPSVVINTGGSLKINGTDGMPINNLSMQSDPDNNAYGRMFSNADKVTVDGDLLIRLRAGSANKWYFLSLPYNVKVSDIVFTNNNPKHAIRYYDGANRAANGANGSWKNFEEDDIIPAGTGFIFQVSEAGWWKIPAQADESKAYLTSNKMFVKALAANESANASDKGWNLVGNPYQSWYNIHKLNFTAPITVRENNNYAAYSVIDDDYAIAPNQAFFVQCPEGITDISFPLDGRQMTSVIESQTGAKPRTADADGAGMRVLTDITVCNGVNTDRTRVVFNESASAEYEINCDASKFMSESADVPQIYSYDEDGIKYAINERPQGNGVVRLGFVAGESGYFTISLTRNMAEKVLLLDKENDVTVDLASQDYGFMSDAGTFENRFELVLREETTGIDETLNADGVTVVPVKGGIDVSGVNGTVEVYSVSGVKVAGCESDGTDRFFSLPKGGYVVKAGGQSVKVVVM